MLAEERIREDRIKQELRALDHHDAHYQGGVVSPGEVPSNLVQWQAACDGGNRLSGNSFFR